MATIKKNKATEARARKKKAAEKKATLAQARKVEVAQKRAAVLAAKKIAAEERKALSIAKKTQKKQLPRKQRKPNMFVFLFFFKIILLFRTEL